MKRKKKVDLNSLESDFWQGDGCTKDYWQGFSTFECPASVLQYGGSLTALLAMSLYGRAGNKSIHAHEPARLHFQSREDALTRKFRVSPPAIRKAFNRLEVDGLVRRERKRDTRTHEWKTTTVRMLNPITGYSLLAIPGSECVLSKAHIHYGAYMPDCFDMPYDCARALYQLPSPSACAVYIAAHVLATRAGNERFTVAKKEWRDVAGISRAAFSRGVRQCRHAKLLHYRASKLTLTDPATGAPNERPPLRKPMPIDFSKMSAQEWEYVCCRMLRVESFPFMHNGWTDPQQVSCPFCYQWKCITFNFEEQRYWCKCKKSGGMLGYFVKDLLRFSRMRDAAKYIENLLGEMRRELQPVPEEQLQDAYV